MTTKLKKRVANWISLGVAVSGGILAVADKIKEMSLIPPDLANAWGLVLALSLVINRVGSILTHPAHTEKDNA